MKMNYNKEIITLSIPCLIYYIHTSIMILYLYLYVCSKNILIMGRIHFNRLINANACTTYLDE